MRDNSSTITQKINITNPPLPALCRWAFAEITHRMKEFHARAQKAPPNADLPGDAARRLYKKLYLTAVYILRI
ncbi:hypothetical protein LNO16_23795 [Klebsiella quasipneumoniae subsp. quasipneumoniae]|uniref:hypothetical protein n=1 Tax=Klebsiella quasipneumoniae TaxID=1463165 RepID=UPI00217E8051|nr:hypothetical protein [Klebsiella quasipneumoniae]MCS5751927.1 hypothetical protein [Klebsiella quasipneumoniae subsp. quasipneumoniae]HCI6737173.1 hypothetical protein [Klebsiella quasipneumoniae subsp. quasipneumoniae]